MTGDPTAGVRVTCIAPTHSAAAILAEVIETICPGALVRSSDPHDPRTLPEGHLVVVEARDADAAIELLRRTRQLIAAGEIALGMQHALNNPLAGLLAEAQLLELEPLDAEHAESVRRIVEQTRRVIEVVRRLDRPDQLGRTGGESTPR